MSTQMSDAERLELLETELNRLRTAREREQQANRELYGLPSLPKGTQKPGAAGWAAETQARQEELRQERIKAAADRETRHEAKLQRNQAKRAKVRGEMGVLADRQKAEQARHLEAHRALGAEIRKLSDHLAALEAYDDQLEPTPPAVASFRSAFTVDPPRNPAKAA